MGELGIGSKGGQSLQNGGKETVRTKEICGPPRPKLKTQSRRSGAWYIKGKIANK